ncbi:FAD-binding oxidoreductase [Trinickia violacea]|uniref:FAD-binding oxidoreductase n=1 Tax=Trinickia violacea TaxID=2571746 RepID=A0A4P8IWY7_9BURK|nr:FAD-binding oxidoreductase [Trinickia violacea]QCP50389.1 FAD-binding oxidoreductase [Trinickia violacea]
MTSSNQGEADIADVLRKSIGSPGVLTDGDVHARSCDPLRSVPVPARVIARPANTEEVAEVFRLCTQRNQTVVVHGGRTGVSGGAYCRDTDIIVSLERMTGIEDICTVGQTAVVQAGVTIEALQAAAREKGLFYPIDLGSKGSATVGGTIATNAGGNRVIRWGMTRQNVLGLEAVLPDGTVVSSMNRLLKNNTGYDLKHLFIGSEGTLGVVTRAVVKLVPMPTSQSVAFVAVSNYERVTELLARARQLPTLSAFEVMWSDFYTLIASHVSEPPIAPGQPFYILVEALGYNKDIDEAMFVAFLEAALESGLIVDAVLATSDRQREDLWRIREGSEVIVREMSPFLSFDVSIEIPRVDAYLAEVRASLLGRFPQARTVTFGHLGDNNIHIGVTIGRETLACGNEIEKIVYDALPSYGGAITAEHGIGQFKREFLAQQKSPAEMDLMRRLRDVLDPSRLLNRDVLC